MKIKSIRKLYFKPIEQFGEIINGERTGNGSYEEFDINGNCTESNDFDAENKLTRRTINKYDCEGNMIEHNKFLTNKTRFIKSTYKYDSRGNRVEHKDINVDGTFSHKRITRFNDQNKPVEEKWYSNNQESVKYKKIWKYDKYGNEMENLSFYVNTTKYDYLDNQELAFETKFTTKFDEKGNIIEEIKYSIGGNVEEKRICKYDNCNNIIEEHKFCNSGYPLLELFKYKYDSLNNLVEKEYKSWKTIPYSRFEKFNGFSNENYADIELDQSYKHRFNYDSSNKLIECSSWHGRTIYKYDENGNNTQKDDYDKKSTLISREIYKYGENNELVDEIIYGSDGLLKKRRKIDYDKMGNLKREIRFENISPILILERDIEYY